MPCMYAGFPQSFADNLSRFITHGAHIADRCIAVRFTCAKRSAMQHSMITHEMLLRRFGDTDETIATAIGVKDYNVRDWRHRGIPADRYGDVLGAALRMKVKLTAEELVTAKRKREAA